MRVYKMVNNHNTCIMIMIIHLKFFLKDETQSSASLLDSASESQHTERAAEGDAVEGKSVAEKGLLVKKNNI